MNYKQNLKRANKSVPSKEALNQIFEKIENAKNIVKNDDDIDKKVLKNLEERIKRKDLNHNYNYEIAQFKAEINAIKLRNEVHPSKNNIVEIAKYEKLIQDC